jgi:hypothetical protein
MNKILYIDFKNKRIKTFLERKIEKLESSTSNIKKLIDELRSLGDEHEKKEKRHQTRQKPRIVRESYQS